MNDWMPKASMAQRSALLATVSDRMASATSGLLLEGVVKRSTNPSDCGTNVSVSQTLKGIAEAALMTIPWAIRRRGSFDMSPGAGFSATK